jgi:demethylmenaquinone methyltransferase/2-methoxy-6-polyprenyl-1,4-benzoquinol methylase
MMRTMFDRIAPKYDLMNRLMTFGMDQSWRRKALQAVAVGPNDVVLDLGCGTGDLSELSVARGASVIGLDVSKAMLYQARRRSIRAVFIRADAEQIPLADSSVSVVVSGFTLRNFVNLKAVLNEIRRVLIPTGRIAFLEVSEPRYHPMRGFHAFYFSKVVPCLGALLSDSRAYSYLPLSVSYLLPGEALFALFERAGFGRIQRTPFFFGSAQLITGIRESTYPTGRSPLF